MNRVLSTLVGAAFTLAVPSAFAGWIDWTSTTTGTMDIGGTSVGVTLTGNPYSFIDGDYYYNNANTGGTSAGGTYGGLVPSDLIQVANAGSYTLTFDQALDDLYMSLVSIGQPGYGVTYDFSNAFSVVSYGSNYWGYGGYTTSGDDFTGSEFNGILHFAGSFSSISFNISPNEFWHGFNFSSDSVSSVPEPSSIALLALGLLGLALGRKSKLAFGK